MMIFIARFSVEWNDLRNLIVTMAMPSYMKDGFSKKMETHHRGFLGEV